MIRATLWGCMLMLAPLAHATTLCRIASMGGLGFGDYDLLAGTASDSQSTVGVTCDRKGGVADVTLEMALDAGTHGLSVSARRMGLAGGAEYLNYGLFRDSARSSVWGNSSGINTVLNRISVPNHGSASATFTIYGRIPALQDVPAGSYTDSVRITISP